MEKFDERNTVPGLTRATSDVFAEICKMECLQGLYLCGGTSISLQLCHRLSEDLDFELLGTRKERPPLDFGGIIREVSSKFPNTSRQILGNSHFLLFLPGNVKLSFFRPENSVPSLGIGYTAYNLKTPTLQELLGMKIYVSTQRNVFRDYYDIFCLLESGCSFREGVKYALDFSRHSIHTKTVFSTLSTAALFPKERDFDANLQPKYIVTPEDICKRLREEIKSIQTPGDPGSGTSWKKICLDGKYNYADKDGTLMSERWFDSATDFKNGIATVERDGKRMDIDTKGIIVKIANACGIRI